MRSADFNRTDSKLRVLEEVRPKKRRVNWDRLIYFFIILASLLTIIYYVARNNLYIRAEGQVLFRKLDIQFTQDIQVVHFFFKEGDEVFIGDTLFLYYDERVINQPPRFQSQQMETRSDNLDWIIRERLTTQKRIELAKLQKKDLLKLSDLTKVEKNRVEKEVYLDIYPASKMDTYVHRLVNYEGGLAAADEEIKFHKKYLGWLASQEQLERALQKSKAVISQGHYPMVTQPYVSPVNGSITQVFKENFEVALQSEIVLSIHKASNLFIKAFYDQKDLGHMHEGDTVSVLFPDGTISQGLLQRFYSATYRLPVEFQKTYEPITRTIAADIVPVSKLDSDRWNAFYKMNAQIYKPRFSFLE